MFTTRITTTLLALAATAAPAFATGAPPLTGAPIPAGGADGAAQGAPPPTFNPTFLILMGGLFVFMILTSVMSGRKEKKKMADMMSSLSRHDRVMTNGGIIGVITEMRDDEVVLKVDEATNTRIRFAKAAIKTVLKPAVHREDSASGAGESIEELKPVESSVV